MTVTAAHEEALPLLGTIPDETYNLALLGTLADETYSDGTYEWDKEGDDWTPIRAPSGMPSVPDFHQLHLVVRRYVPVAVTVAATRKPKKTDADRTKIDSVISLRRLKTRASKLNVLDQMLAAGTVDRIALEAFGHSEWSRGFLDGVKDATE